MARRSVLPGPLNAIRICELVLAHLGGLRMWDDVRRHLLPAGGNVYFDTAYVSFYMGREEMGELIRDIGPERVIFGSDYPWEEPGRAAEIIKGLGLVKRKSKQYSARMRPDSWMKSFRNRPKVYTS